MFTLAKILAKARSSQQRFSAAFCKIEKKEENIAKGKQWETIKLFRKVKKRNQCKRIQQRVTMATGNSVKYENSRQVRLVPEHWMWFPFFCSFFVDYKLITDARRVVGLVFLWVSGEWKHEKCTQNAFIIWSLFNKQKQKSTNARRKWRKRREMEFGKCQKIFNYQYSHDGQTFINTKIWRIFMNHLNRFYVIQWPFIWSSFHVIQFMFSSEGWKCCRKWKRWCRSKEKWNKRLQWQRRQSTWRKTPQWINNDTTHTRSNKRNFVGIVFAEQRQMTSNSKEQRDDSQKREKSAVLSRLFEVLSSKHYKV